MLKRWWILRQHIENKRTKKETKIETYLKSNLTIMSSVGTLILVRCKIMKNKDINYRLFV